MTDATSVLATVALGAVGALLRAEVTWWSVRRTGSARSGTWAVNVLGALALGVVVTLGADGHLDDRAAAVVGLGLLGGLTTFSTWMVLVLRPDGSGADGGRRSSHDVLVHGGGMLVVGVAAAAVGAALARLAA
ncbi:MAG: CrcB family protein [Actinobacteria bacterium]|nr:CrcB family protein [Actinomycetota bacterium]